MAVAALAARVVEVIADLVPKAQDAARDSWPGFMDTLGGAPVPLQLVPG